MFVRAAGVALAVALLWLVWSLGGALLAPGTDSMSARVAEWARNNQLGWVVDGLEQLQYQLNPPRVGGVLAGGIPTVSPDEPASSPPAASGPPTTGGPVGGSTLGVTPAATPPPRPGPEPIPPQVKPALPSEGVWQTLERLRGQPAMRVAFLRPDAQHTSYLVSVVWLDQNLVKLVQHPGFQQPGGSGWSQPNEVPPSERDSLLATFNSGFRLTDSDGGYWADGITAAPLRQGAASMVFYKDGHVDIVKWGGGTPGPDVVAVRQNLVLLVDNGVVSPEVDSATTPVWGNTYTTRFYVWRTAIGIRSDGSLVFVIGPALNVGSLARIARAAGAVRAMELDINPAWTNFMTYSHPSKDVAVPHMLTKDEQPNPYRYLQPSSRDFVAVMARG